MSKEIPDYIQKLIDKAKADGADVKLVRVDKDGNEIEEIDISAKENETNKIFKGDIGDKCGNLAKYAKLSHKLSPDAQKIFDMMSDNIDAFMEAVVYTYANGARLEEEAGRRPEYIAQINKLIGTVVGACRHLTGIETLNILTSYRTKLDNTDDVTHDTMSFGVETEEELKEILQGHIDALDEVINEK